ncbi:MAG: glycosyltransferase family 9 protein [Deltaproteobacteria bacterium]|nr:glycosyltransferase family 9 protein [Deltaproteobacteria bacterium]
MRFKKICVIHLNQIGDLVFSLPLLKALRENFLDASIHSVVKPYLEELLSGSPYVDRIILRKRGLKAQRELLKNIRKNRYDLLISLSTSEECLTLTAFSKARVKAGFSRFPWNVCLDVKDTIEGHNSWRNNLKLLKRLNVNVNKNDYVGLLSLDKNECDLTLPNKFVIISPGASRRRFAKTWGEAKFAELMLSLKNKYDLIPVLVGGKDNLEYNNTIIRQLRENDQGKGMDVINTTGTGLRELCSMIKDASLFVGIDSGIMHLASSLDIPVVGIFGPTDPFYVGPQNDRSIVVREEEMKCVPCYLKACNHRDCMKKLTVDKVLHACEQILTK